MKDSSDRYIKLEISKLYRQYKNELVKLKKISKEKDYLALSFKRGLLPLYTLYILTLGPTSSNDIRNVIGEKTKYLWFLTSEDISRLLIKFQKDDLVIYKLQDNKKLYMLTEKGLKEFETKKKLLLPKIEEALLIFQVIHSDLFK